jgi:hypothetical protein
MGRGFVLRSRAKYNRSMASCSGSSPRAAEGDFYTIPENCITCGGPHVEAPTLLDWHEKGADSTYTHCIFNRQPTTPEELEAAIRAMKASCVNNLRYRGRDMQILKLMEARGLRSQCDHPIRWWQRLASRWTK